MTTYPLTARKGGQLSFDHGFSPRSSARDRIRPKFVLLLLGLLIALFARLARAEQPAKPPDDSAAGAQQHFDVAEYRVLGNTVLANRSIETVLYPLLGPGKSLKDVEQARAQLEKLYHDQGYGTAFVDIPPQTIEGGIVRLRVTEGRVEKERVAGARYSSERDVIAKLPAATPGNVLQLSKLQEELGAINAETPDRSVVPVLKAGAEPGTVDLAFTVNDKLPLHGSLEFNNQNTIGTHELRGIASLAYDDLWGVRDSLSLQYQFTPQQFDQVRVIAANYQFHTFENGLQPSFTYVNSNSTVPTVGTLGVLGIGEIYSTRLGYELFKSQNTLQSISLGVDYKHFRNTINVDATSALSTPISYLNLSAAYSGYWHYEGATTTFSVSADAGPRGLVNNSTAFANDRYKGRANYFYVRADWSTVFRLPADFSLRLRAAGQAAAEPLITNEDFSIAGVDGVRGYLEAEELADKAIKGTVQLNSPGWHWHNHRLVDGYLFYDVGRGALIDPLPGEPSGETLRSWGAGLDLLPGEKLIGILTWAKPLDDASVTRADSARWLFVVRGSF
ncbi:MAG TPA: ShlB/FhaC/HecB family hemolysin secretion/activation protein [Steroidobacteraceae bacterium]